MTQSEKLAATYGSYKLGRIPESMLATVLGRLQSESAYRALHSRLDHPVLEKRIAAMWALHNYRRIDDISTVANQLTESSPDLRAAAALYLGHVGWSPAVESLVAATKDSVLQVRRNAVVALGEIGDAAALPAVIRVANEAASDDGDLLEKAIVAISRVGGNENSIPIIMNLLTPHYPVAMAVALSILRIAGSQIEDTFTKLLENSSHVVRLASVKALGSFTERPLVQLLRRAVKDPSNGVRQAAVEVIAKQSSQRARKLLSQYGNGERPFVDPLKPFESSRISMLAQTLATTNEQIVRYLKRLEDTWGMHLLN